MGHFITSCKTYNVLRVRPKCITKIRTKIDLAACAKLILGPRGSAIQLSAKHGNFVPNNALLKWLSAIIHRDLDSA